MSYPSDKSIIFAKSDTTIEWTGSSKSNFEIDLFHGHDCLEWVTALCPHMETGCPDSEGDYDVEFPEPMTNTSGHVYTIGVLDMKTEDFGCSDGFVLLGSGSKPPAEPYVEVLEPQYGDLALTGETYTVEFDYDNGWGSRRGRFDIDLFSSDAPLVEGCGSFVETLCLKDSGCRDTAGDFDIEIPEYVENGYYRIRVGVHGSTVYGCSHRFDVVAYDDYDSFSFSFGSFDLDLYSFSF